MHSNFNPRTIWRYRSLVFQLAKRDVDARYRGSVLGLLWSLLTPLSMLAIYTFVFGVVLRARWPQSASGEVGHYAIISFWGLTVFNLLSDTLNRSCRLISSNPNYVKKIAFPLEVMIVSLLASNLFQMLASLAVLLPATAVAFGWTGWSVALLPVVIFPLILFALGLSWFLSSIGVFVQDVEYTVSLLVQALFFVTPILYALESIPQQYRWIVALNPLAGVVEDVRSVALWGMAPDWPGLLFRTSIGAVTAVLGYVWFLKTKRAFADVL